MHCRSTSVNKIVLNESRNAVQPKAGRHFFYWSGMVSGFKRQKDVLMAIIFCDELTQVIAESRKSKVSLFSSA
jgi:hypothetical protein